MASATDASGPSQSNRGRLAGEIGVGEDSPVPTAAGRGPREVDVLGWHVRASPATPVDGSRTHPRDPTGSAHVHHAKGVSE
jgi:hypothetical protein